MEKPIVESVKTAKPVRGITRRLIFLIVLFSSMITLVITVIQLVEEYFDGVDQVRDQIIQIETLVLPSLTANLWNLYEKQVQIQLDDLARNPDVLNLEIRFRGELIASSGLQSKSENTITETIPMVYYRGDEEILIGKLTVLATLDGVYRRLYERVLSILISNAMKTALVSLFMFFLFQILVTKHLNSISTYLQEFSFDQTDRKLSLDRKSRGDEIDMVVDKINQLMINLAESTVSRHHLEEIVEERTQELHNAQEELLRNERLATLGQLTATVSHELRNPLGAMRPSLYLIKKPLLELKDEKLQAAYDRIDRGIDRCDKIIDELLDFTRITELDKQATRVDEWLEFVIDEQDIPQDILLDKNFTLNNIELDIDTSRLRRAVINLVDNAWQAMQDGSKVGNSRNSRRLGIKTIARQDRVEIDISDTGPGISEDVLRKIFEPLFSTKSFGVGLGMPTVKQIMEQHGGGIEIDSEEGKGTTVTLWFPYKQI